jgi:hypothetical protein
MPFIANLHPQRIKEHYWIHPVQWEGLQVSRAVQQFVQEFVSDCHTRFFLGGYCPSMASKRKIPDRLGMEAAPAFVLFNALIAATALALHQGFLAVCRMIR